MARGCWALLLVLAGVSVSSCTDNSPPPEDKSAGVDLPGNSADLLQWVQTLHDLYDRRGIAAFLEAKARLMEPGKDWADDDDYGVVGLVLLNEEVLSRGQADSVGREKELAIRLRALANDIERHPGASEESWRQFRAHLISFSFGNSPVVRGTAAEGLVTLYAKIAGCEMQWRQDLRTISISVEEAIEKGYAPPRWRVSRS
jgi:hypothetical protein